MKKKAFAKNSDGLDRRFDAGEDIHDLTDMSQAKITRPGRSPGDSPPRCGLCRGRFFFIAQPHPTQAKSLAYLTP